MWIDTEEVAGSSQIVTKSPYSTQIANDQQGSSKPLGLGTQRAAASSFGKAISRIPAPSQSPRIIGRFAKGRSVRFHDQVVEDLFDQSRAPVS